MKHYTALLTARTTDPRTGALIITVKHRTELIAIQPFDPDLPELDAHLLAVRSCLPSLVVGVIDVVAYAELEPLHYVFLFDKFEVKPNDKP